MIRMLGWEDLRARGERRSKSQIRRDIRAGKFPKPAGYNGQSPFWLEEQLDAHLIGSRSTPPKNTSRGTIEMTEKSPDPFDPAALRLDQTFTDGTAVKSF